MDLVTTKKVGRLPRPKGKPRGRALTPARARDLIRRRWAPDAPGVVDDDLMPANDGPRPAGAPLSPGAAPAPGPRILDFLATLKWLDGSPLLEQIEPYRRDLFMRALET